MQYDGVETHGPLHKARMRDVVHRRTLIEYHKTVALVTALLGERQAAVSLLRQLLETMFPGTEQARLKREAEQATALAEESTRSYYLREAKIKDG